MLGRRQASRVAVSSSTSRMDETEALRGCRFESFVSNEGVHVDGFGQDQATGGGSDSSVEGKRDNQIRSEDLEKNKGVFAGRVNGWSSLFTSKRVDDSAKLGFIPVPKIEGKNQVKLSSMEFKEEITSWENYLVGSFIGRRPDFHFVRQSLKQIWNLKGDFEMVAQGVSCFFFKFLNDEDRLKVLEGGPIYISSRIFLIRQWEPFIETELAALHTVPIWVSLRNVPVHFWNQKGLSSISSALGRPIMMDRATVEKSRLAYARVCVEIDIHRTYPSSIDIVVDDCRKLEVQVEYSWRPQKCSNCAVFGHNVRHCPRLKPQGKRPLKSFLPKQVGGDASRPADDGWNTVTAKSRPVPSGGISSSTADQVFIKMPTSDPISPMQAKSASVTSQHIG